MKNIAKISKLTAVIITLTVTTLYCWSYHFNTIDKMKRITKYGTTIQASFNINAFNPNPHKYGFQNYNEKETMNFLTSVYDKFNTGDIIEVDGLKWMKTTAMIWKPFPNPPIPVLEPNENKMKHFKEYAKWINDHPHFGYPPLPVPIEELSKM